MKTLIAVPCMDTVDAYFARSLANLVKVGETVIEFEIGTLVNFARDKLAGKAITAGADYILWLDSDMVFEEDLMIRLMADIRGSGADLVSAVYHYRKPPYKPVLWDVFREEKIHGTDEKRQLLSYPKDQGLIPIEACGFGACIMKTGMITGIMERYQALFEPLPHVGEDMSFCARATERGYRLMADPTLQLGHRGYLISDWRQWEAWQAEEAENDKRNQ